jgi:hypothetical protein
MDAGEIAVAPQSSQVHSPTALGLGITGKAVERPEMVVRVDRGNRIKSSLLAVVRGRLSRSLPPGQRGHEQEEDPTSLPKTVAASPHDAIPPGDDEIHRSLLTVDKILVLRSSVNKWREAPEVVFRGVVEAAGRVRV